MISIDRKDRRRVSLCAIILAALLLLPLLISSSSLDVLILVFYFAALGCAWNLIGGMGGQLSLGHAAFVGIGAYTSTILLTKYGLPPVAGMIVGGFLAALTGAFIGYLCFRLRGPYFTLATIALAEILLILCNYFRSITNGALGISLPSKPGFWNLTYNNITSYYYLFLIFMVVCVLMGVKVKNSQLGAYLTATKEDEDAAESLGVNAFRTKMQAMLLSAFLAAIGGTLYAQYIKYIDPETTFDIMISIDMALVAMIGSKGTVTGPVLGAALIVPIKELLRNWLGGSLEGISYAVYALIVIGVAVLMPEGIIVGVGSWMKARPWLRAYVLQVPPNH